LEPRRDLHHCTFTGADRLRPGYKKLMEDARAGAFDVLITETLDRLSRNREDAPALDIGDDPVPLRA
jgi:DNA invertase Pin-like site-specific DNA recombinase